MGKIVANDSESYKYLAESIRMHPDQRTLKGMMEQAGFQTVTTITSLVVLLLFTVVLNLKGVPQCGQFCHWCSQKRDHSSCY